MDHDIPEWMIGLAPEDWQFIKRMLLTSGSLKDVARQYGISYPTVRIKLNRLIEKIRILDSAKPKTEFHRKIKLLVTEDKLDISVARTIIKAFEESKK